LNAPNSNLGKQVYQSGEQVEADNRCKWAPPAARSAHPVALGSFPPWPDVLAASVYFTSRAARSWRQLSGHACNPPPSRSCPRREGKPTHWAALTFVAAQ